MPNFYKKPSPDPIWPASWYFNKPYGQLLIGPPGFDHKDYRELEPIDCACGYGVTWTHHCAMQCEADKVAAKHGLTRKIKLFSLAIPNKSKEV